jgi:hypothetical protein
MFIYALYIKMVLLGLIDQYGLINETCKQNVERYNRFTAQQVLAGPLSLTFIPYFYGKAFYIFGDVHTKTTECKGLVLPKRPKHISKFLDQHFATNGLRGKEYIDFYLEQYLPVKSYSSVTISHWWGPRAKFPIGKIESTFSPCIKVSPPQNTDCTKWANTRFHSTDIRFATRNGGLFHEPTILQTLENLSLPSSSYYEIMTAFLISGDMYLNYINSILTTTKSEDFLNDAIKDLRKVLERNLGRNDSHFKNTLNKELSKSYLTLEIAEWAFDNFVLFSEQIDDILDTPCSWTEEDLTLQEFAISMVLNFKKEDLKKSYFPKAASKELEKFAALIHAIYLRTSVLLTDMYTLSRIFKRDTTEDTREVWVYTGELHAVNIINFLEFVSKRHISEFGLKTPESHKPSKQCLITSKYDTKRLTKNSKGQMNIAVIYDKDTDKAPVPKAPKVPVPKAPKKVPVPKVPVPKVPVPKVPKEPKEPKEPKPPVPKVPKVPKAPKVPKPPVPKTPATNITVYMWKERCKNKGIKGYSKLKKAELETLCQ